MLKPYRTFTPEVHSTAFVEESAQVIGNVTIGPDASIWPNAVLRGDVHAIRIGARTSIQDGSVLHGTYKKYPVIVESDVTVGHNVVLHGCVIHSNCLIGMGAIVLDDAEIGPNCIIGAGAVVTQGTKIPPNSMVLGVPGKIKRQLTDEEVQDLRTRAARYVEYKNTYLQAL